MESENKKTVILGASTNPSRFSFHAANRLNQKGIDFVPVGLKKGAVAGKEILDIREKPMIKDVHTITLYINPKNQVPYYEYIQRLKPRRIIFNPGTENEELARLARAHHIETIHDCTLVMLGRNLY
ncbi:MAG: CoA-binding protein [Cyclobacteriaceae bacterium]|nr:CoA-binding protein [Cyclobacteriaceae bacterium]